MLLKIMDKNSKINNFPKCQQRMINNLLHLKSRIIYEYIEFSVKKFKLSLNKKNNDKEQDKQNHF